MYVNAIAFVLTALMSTAAHANETQAVNSILSQAQNLESQMDHEPASLGNLTANGQKIGFSTGRFLARVLTPDLKKYAPDNRAKIITAVSRLLVRIADYDPKGDNVAAADDGIDLYVHEIAATLKNFEKSRVFTAEQMKGVRWVLALAKNQKEGNAR